MASKAANPETAPRAIGPQKVAGGRRTARRVAIGFGIPVLAVLSVYAYMGQLSGNIRTVLPGKVYRSGQISGNLLDTAIRERSVHTIINLQGTGPKDAAYRSEVSVCRRLGVDHYDIPMSATHYPPPQGLKRVLDVFDHARYPVMLHCHAGADRSGLVSTLYAALYNREPLDQAESEQLTWRYGHLSFGKTHYMDDFFTMYRKDAHGMDLRTWILTRYPALYQQLPERDKMPPVKGRVLLPTTN